MFAPISAQIHDSSTASWSNFGTSLAYTLGICGSSWVVFHGDSTDVDQPPGTCAVADPSGDFAYFAFEPDGLRMEAMMAQYRQAEAGAIEAKAIDHLVVLEGWTMTDVKWLDLRQKLSRVQRKAAPLMEELRGAKTEASRRWVVGCRTNLLRIQSCSFPIHPKLLFPMARVHGKGLVHKSKMGLLP